MVPLTPTKPLLGEDGEVFVYIEPFPQDATRLNFTVAGLSAVRSDGAEFPLTLHISDFNGTDVKRQRLMASGILPAGQYRGFSFSVKKASLKSEEGESALLLPDKPEQSSFVFEMKKKKATVISMAFKYRDSLPGGFSFHPAFAMQIPANPLSTLTGYVSNESSNTVTVFDKRAGKVAKVIETGRGPARIALDQALARAYVAVSGDDAVEIVDILQNEIVSNIQLNTGDLPRDLALTPDGKVLITVNTNSNSISFVDPVAQTELSRTNVGTKPVSILIDRTGKRAYVFNNLSNTISVVDIVSRLVAGTIATESGPVRGQFNQKGDRLLVFHDMSPNILVFDLASLSVVKRVYEGIGVSALKVNSLTDLSYVGKRNSGTIDIFDPFSYLPGDFISAEGGVAYMTIDGDENNLVVLHPGSKTVQFINLISKKEVATIDVGEDPYWVTLFGEK